MNLTFWTILGVAYLPILCCVMGGMYTFFDSDYYAVIMQEVPGEFFMVSMSVALSALWPITIWFILPYMIRHFFKYREYSDAFKTKK